MQRFHLSCHKRCQLTQKEHCQAREESRLLHLLRCQLYSRVWKHHGDTDSMELVGLSFFPRSAPLIPLSVVSQVWWWLQSKSSLCSRKINLQQSQHKAHPFQDCGSRNCIPPISHLDPRSWNRTCRRRWQSVPCFRKYVEALGLCQTGQHDSRWLRTSASPRPHAALTCKLLVWNCGFRTAPVFADDYLGVWFGFQDF